MFSCKYIVHTVSDGYNLGVYHMVQWYGFQLRGMTYDF
jgi:hypothetical protein